MGLYQESCCSLVKMQVPSDFLVFCAWSQSSPQALVDGSGTESQNIWQLSTSQPYFLTAKCETHTDGWP